MRSSLFPVQELKRRTLAWAVKLRVNPRVVRVQEMRRKWGSCSSRGTVTLATDLVDQDERFIDRISRFMLVPQHGIGDDTGLIASLYPKSWHYLQSHIELFEKRKSSIYRDKPKFSIFGVGEYSFAPWKVAISGLYKSFSFRVIGPYEGKPVVFDDTCYFLACESEREAVFIRDVLTSKACLEILDAFVFWDSKRPITKDILSSIDIRGAAKFLGREEEFNNIFVRRHSSDQQSTLF